MSTKLNVVFYKQNDCENRASFTVIPEAFMCVNDYYTAMLYSCGSDEVLSNGISYRFTCVWDVMDNSHLLNSLFYNTKDLFRPEYLVLGGGVGSLVLKTASAKEFITPLSIAAVWFQFVLKICTFLVIWGLPAFSFQLLNHNVSVCKAQESYTIKFPFPKKVLIDCSHVIPLLI